MSKLLHAIAIGTTTGEKIRRTIEHSPDLGDGQADDRPSGRIPPGGYLTG
ncbi:hypothetical protein [Natrarchaeobius chitinivorans]|nr:hypothetical protein [Natrarchaeobius chitinivorans]